MKTTDMRGLTVQELKDKIEAETMAYDKMLLTHHVTPLDKPSELTARRKLIARLHTVLSEKLNENKEFIQE